jgi:glycosyltransferase involved in cell wall biosynthesis
MSLRRILHVIPSVAPRDGGPSVAVVGMARALRARGHAVLIATTDADGPARLNVSGDETEWRGVPTRFFRRQATESFKWSAPLARWLQASVRHYDLVHIHAVFSHASLAAGRACRRSGVPYVVRPLGSLDPWSLSQHGWRKRLLLAGGAMRMLRFAARMHYTTSDEQRLAEMAVSGLPPGSVVPIGVDDHFFAPTRTRPERREPLIVVAARLHPKKGIDVLIDAFHKLPAPLAHWRLAIAGDGEAAYTNVLKQRAWAGPAAPRIEFAGWLDVERRASLFDRARLFVLPSFQENFGIAVAEALATGLPAAVSAGVNLSGAIRHDGAGWIIERSDESLAAALAEILLHEPELDRRGMIASRVARQFQWPVVAGHLESMYELILTSPTRRASVVKTTDAVVH